MRRLSLVLCGAILLFIPGRVVAAQTIRINPASAGPLVVSTAVAGQQPVPVTTGGGTYTLSMRRRGGNTRITARLNRPLPAGTTLWISLVSPGGTAQSVGLVQLSTSPQDVITNIRVSNRNYPPQAITYQFSALTAAGVVALRSIRVILALAP